MKKTMFVCVALFLIAGAVMAQAAKGGVMYVAVKTLSLKSSTGIFARTLETLSYGTQVKVLQVSGKWAQVQPAAGSSVSGWTTVSNLSAKRVVSQSSSTASAKEVALAGKGFNEEIENVYKTKGTLNYADVDLTERQLVPESDLAQFLSEGHLSMGDKQ